MGGCSSSLRHGRNFPAHIALWSRGIGVPRVMASKGRYCRRRALGAAVFGTRIIRHGWGAREGMSSLANSPIIAPQRGANRSKTKPTRASRKRCKSLPKANALGKHLKVSPSCCRKQVAVEWSPLSSTCITHRPVSPAEASCHTGCQVTRDIKREKRERYPQPLGTVAMCSGVKFA